MLFAAVATAAAAVAVFVVVVVVFLIFSLRGRMLYWFSALLLSKTGEAHDELSYGI